MSLYKSEPTIAKEYARLCLDSQVEENIYQLFFKEYNNTCEQILSITNLEHLLEDNPALVLSLERRNPYLDPINYIQVTLLKRYRQTARDETQESPWLDPLLRSINTLAAGLRNTG
jgi:phosphoenolpyruvate carboxylase